MKKTPSRKQDWPRKVTLGRVSVTIYRRTAPNGSHGFMVANYSGDKRRFDSYSTEAEALEAAAKLARQLSEKDTIGASMTKEECIEYAAAIQTLKPLGITLSAAVAAVAAAVKLTGDLAGMAAAAQFYKDKHQTVTPKTTAAALVDMLELKKQHEASERYLQDLGYRLKRFTDDFVCEVGNITESDVQGWLDKQKFKPVNYMSFCRGLNVFFKFCLQKKYCLSNPCTSLQRPPKKALRGGKTEIYTVKQTSDLLGAAKAEYLPALAIGAFAGVRSAEIERLAWSSVNLVDRFIELGSDDTKTGSRRTVPISNNLAEWLALVPESKRTGLIWKGGHFPFYAAQKETAAKAGVKWKINALRHSYCSYRLAGTQDAAKVSLEAGNSPQMIFKHYHKIVQPPVAVEYFSINPPATVNALPSSPIIPQLPEPAAPVAAVVEV